VTDVASIESVFERKSRLERNRREAIQNSKSIRKKNHQTQTKRTADKVLRLLSAHISFAVDVR